MEPNIQNSSGMMNGMPPVVTKDRKIGPIVGALVIVLIIIISTLYFFGQRLNTEPQTSSENETPVRNEVALSSSNEVQDLNADLDAQLNNVDYSF